MGSENFRIKGGSELAYLYEESSNYQKVLRDRKILLSHFQKTKSENVYNYIKRTNFNRHLRIVLNLKLRKKYLLQFLI